MDPGEPSDPVDPELRLHVERAEQQLRRSRELAAQSAEAAEHTAEIEHEVAAVHERIAATRGGDPEFLAKADHARRSAAESEAFAKAERESAEAPDPAQARERFEPYRQPAPE